MAIAQHLGWWLENQQFNVILVPLGHMNPCLKKEKEKKMCGKNQAFCSHLEQ